VESSKKTAGVQCKKNILAAKKGGCIGVLIINWEIDLLSGFFLNIPAIEGLKKKLKTSK